MPTRLSFRLAMVALLLLAVAFAKDKKADKASVLPAFVTDAHTVTVVVFPGASNPVDNPGANVSAQTAVENALSKWGHYRVGVDPQTSDLVIAIRKGDTKPGPKIGGGPVNDRPGTLDTSNGGIRIGGQQGRAPNVGWDPRASSPNDSPRVENSMGTTEDIFEVYRGNQSFPLDSAPLWRYSAKDALKSPNVPAVAAFRKAVEDGSKPAPTPPPTKP